MTFALAVLAALCATYWALRSTDANGVPTSALPATDHFAALDPLALARALGGGQSGAAHASGDASAAPGRTPYVLIGVIADRSLGGAALISVDGKAAKPYRVGATVDGNLVLQSVAARRAVLAAGVDGPAHITLEMPPLGK